MAKAPALLGSRYWAVLKGYVRGVDCLVPLLRYAAEHAGPDAAQARNLRAVELALDGLASCIAAELVEKGERVRFPPPPTPALIARAFASSGGEDDHDALELCVQWCRAIDDVLYFYGDQVFGRKRGDMLLDAASSEGLEPLMVGFLVAHAMVDDALRGPKAVCLSRLGMASDRHYLREAQKALLRL